MNPSLAMNPIAISAARYPVEWLNYWFFWQNFKTNIISIW